MKESRAGEGNPLRWSPWSSAEALRLLLGLVPGKRSFQEKGSSVSLISWPLGVEATNEFKMVGNPSPHRAAQMVGNFSNASFSPATPP